MKIGALSLIFFLALFSIILVLLLTPCSPSLPVHATTQETTVIYVPTTALFPNPERGFYHYTATHSNDYTPLDLAMLQGYRQNENITLIQRCFYLDDFVDSDISQTYLTAMQADFDTLREAGLKVIVRFAYTDQLHFAPGTDWPPIPPYGDAGKEWILRHIEQLRPVLQANSDVIAVMQAGFIGIWGEWFYTDYFVQDPWNPGEVTPEDYANRGKVLTTILGVLPANRMVQLRTPRYKVNTIPESASYTPISLAEAHSGTNIARTGHHNDCFLASETDYGTYISPPIEYPYLEAETLYLSMGGETCNDTTDDDPPSDRSLCPTALEELARFHWSYLNIDYHPGVLASWDAGVPPHDCLDEVKRRLGYRFTLIEGTYTKEVKPGDKFTIDIKLRNDGWGAPFNPRLVELWLRHKTRDVLYYATLPDDPRFWLGDASTTYSLNRTICTPIDMPLGDYELLLRLPDPEPSLYWRPEYAIRLANDQVWEDNTGYNKLLHTITVTGIANGPACDSPLILKPVFRVYLPVILRHRPRSQSHKYPLPQAFCTFHHCLPIVPLAITIT